MQLGDRNSHCCPKHKLQSEKWARLSVLTSLLLHHNCHQLISVHYFGRTQETVRLCRVPEFDVRGPENKLALFV